jgi:transposase
VIDLIRTMATGNRLWGAERTATQRGPDFIASHVRAFEYLGGVAAALVPDQLKSGVSQPYRYEPGIQRTYEEMARRYGTTVLPAVSCSSC